LESHGRQKSETHRENVSNEVNGDSGTSAGSNQESEMKTDDSQDARYISKRLEYQDSNGSTSSEKGKQVEEPKIEEEKGHPKKDLLAPHVQTYQASIVQIYDEQSPKVPNERLKVPSVEETYTLVQRSGQKKKGKGQITKVEKHL
jgi:hypothetical protein